MSDRLPICKFFLLFFKVMKVKTFITQFIFPPHRGLKVEKVGLDSTLEQVHRLDF